jgi:hypothetical protein
MVMTGCSKEQPKIPKTADFLVPVKVTGTFNQARIMSDNILDLEFEWILLKKEPAVTDDFKILLHFVDEHGEVLFQDDHEPPVPTSAWKVEESLKYTRPVYIPFSVEEKNTTILIGLYDEKRMHRKVGLSGMSVIYKPGRYVLGSLVIEASNDFTLDTERMDFKKGWYPLERDVQHRLQWRWTRKEAVCSLRNPGEDAVLYLRGWVPELDTAPDIEIILNNQVLEKFSATGEFIKKFEIKKEKLGDNKWIDLVLKTNKLYIPKEHGHLHDPRKLGIMIKRIFFR